jgi:hypothetical protein
VVVIRRDLASPRLRDKKIAEWLTYASAAVAFGDMTGSYSSSGVPKLRISQSVTRRMKVRCHLGHVHFDDRVRGLKFDDRSFANNEIQSMLSHNI